jgi:NADH:ubiquinone oxidoreductase subunit 6 (subunit J)
MFGTAKAIGMELFAKHIVAFELASGLLLVAAVGVICLAKFSFAPLRRRTR